MLPPATAAQRHRGLCRMRAPPDQGRREGAREGRGRAGAEGVRDRRQALSARPQAGCAHRVSVSADMTASPRADPPAGDPGGGAADCRDDGRSGGYRPRHRADELARARRACGLPRFVLYGDPQVLAGARACARRRACRSRPSRRPGEAAAAHLPTRCPSAGAGLGRAGGGDAAIVAAIENGDGSRDGRRGAGAGDQPDHQAHAQSGPPALPRTHRVPGRAGRASRAAAATSAGHDAGRPTSSRLCRPPCTFRWRRWPKALTRPLLLETIRITAAALTGDFGIARPRIAVTGLNPHAGEGGLIGREEVEVIAPAIAELAAEGSGRDGSACGRHAVPRRGARHL